MPTFSRNSLIVNGYGVWAGHVLRGALEGTTQETFSDQQVTDLVTRWLGTPSPPDSASVRAIVLAVGEAPAEGDTVIRTGADWTSGPPPSGLAPIAQTLTAAGPITSAFVLLDATGGAFMATLPDATTFRRAVNAKATATNSNRVTLTPVGGQLIDGAATVQIGSPSSGAPYSAVTLIPDGTNWRIV